MLYNKPEIIKRYAPVLPGVQAPETLHNEEPFVCVAINHSWIPLILGALEIFKFDDLLAGSPESVEHASQEVVSLMIAIAEGNIPCTGGIDMPYLLRQNSFDPCVLEQSLDNGLTWTVAFDFGICRPSITAPTAQQHEVNVLSYNTLMIDIQNVYDGSPESVAPDMVYDGTPSDDDRDLSICYAINMFVTTFAAQYEDKIGKGYDWKDYAQIAASITALGAASIFAVAALPTVTLGAGVIAGAGVAEVVAQFVLNTLPLLPEEDNYDAILEASIQQYITCVANDALQGSIPDAAAFASAWDALDPAIIGADLVALFQHIAESERLYLQFLDFTQRGWDALDNGQQYTCSCGEYMWTFDFTAESGSEPFTSYGQGSWAVILSNAGMGEYLSTVGWLFRDESTGDFRSSRGVSIRLLGVTGNIKFAKAVFDRVEGNYEQENDEAAVIEYGGDRRSFSVPFVPEGNSVEISRTATRNMSDEGLYVTINSDSRLGSQPTPIGNGLLKKIIVTGTGSVPDAFIY